LGERVIREGRAEENICVGQWEGFLDAPQQTQNPLVALHRYMVDSNINTLYSSTQIMITPGYRFRTVNRLITNFHQPGSTLLLLVSAFVGDKWRDIYEHALTHGYRFLSYGDSSLLRAAEL
jgi:S-adenosylmethionine:tRNA ribosyltransferase-isomerase